MRDVVEMRIDAQRAAATPDVSLHSTRVTMARITTLHSWLALLRTSTACTAQAVLREMHCRQGSLHPHLGAIWGGACGCPATMGAAAVLCRDCRACCGCLSAGLHRGCDWAALLVLQPADLLSLGSWQDGRCIACAMLSMC